MPCAKYTNCLRIDTSSEATIRAELTKLLAEAFPRFIPVATFTAGIRRVGSAAIDLAWLAAGRFEAFWELHLSPCDIAAGILLFGEAGGGVTGMDDVQAHISTSAIVAGDPDMHAWLLQNLRAAAEGQSA